jgi:hypothetical protein
LIRPTLAFAVVVVALWTADGFAQRAASDDEIRKMMIEESISGYRGNCPCPYNLASNGSRCGGRSAWSRPGGAKPICYENEIADQMIADFRRRKGLAR